ncbi:hypothetical protein M434DRAFT_384027 [Hypoxylon sp. CO27-5]|nr:hypothetical protein M434DRAFT_384027 [Hypoxylon sp. CO27-5]
MNGALNYPVNLLRTGAFHHTLQSYRRSLNGNKIFDSEYRSLACIDLYENDHEFHRSKKLNTLDKLSGYIDEEDGAPLWRLVFLQSATSRSALGCTKEQLMFLLSYYQVMPSFLDFLLTFRVRGTPVAHAQFRHENYLGKNSPELVLPQFRRSGIQIQHAFNLLSVEQASDPCEKNQWPLRQVALYHSFDGTNGRCFWIILKGNELMARRIFSATEQHRQLKAQEITSPETSFAASLQVQMIMIEWCSENWAEYIDHLEKEVATSSVEGKAAPVDKMTSSTGIETMHSPRSTNTWGSQAGSSPINPRRRMFPRSSSNLLAVFRRLSRLKSGMPTTSQDETIEDVEAKPSLEEEENNEGDKLSDLERDFPFKKFQRLSLLTQELDQALVVIEQNKGVLNAMDEHYLSVSKSHGFTAHMKTNLCDSDLMTFRTKIQSIERDLDIHYSRLQALSRALENDKTLFTTLLQYKSAKVSDYMTRKMHDIAVRTEQETLSMHVITIFTLIFLPGTFIATLFSSGVFHWDDDGSLGSDWVIRKNALKLFFSVSLPMMAIILSAWSLLYLYMRRKRHQAESNLLTLALYLRVRNWSTLLYFAWPISSQLSSSPNYRDNQTGFMTQMRRARRAAARLSKSPPNYTSARNNGPFEEFFRIVDEQANQHIERFSDNDQKFVPLPVLYEYWTRPRISKILNAFHPPLSFNIDTIRDSYIRTFSTLVYCNRVADFHNFTHYNLNDNRLPLEKRPGEWKGSFFDSLFNKISLHQWLFFPLIFTHAHLEDRYLDPRQILPITKLERLSHDRITQGDAAIIQKITIDSSCNFLVPQNEKDGPMTDTFVLKKYHRPKFSKYYEREIKALRMLKNSSPPNVIKYYGSFRQNGTYNIILEYADGGDLAEFLRRTRSPKGVEVQEFWESLSPCFRGLHCVHHLMDIDGKVNGIHEDIKPENILLFKGLSGSHYDFVPKIADFGLFTHVRESKANSSEATGLDQVGNQLYSNAPNMINTRADIFSLGAVLSDVCAWIKGGHEEIISYLNRRRAYHQSMRTFRGNDYEGCFHDGVSRLSVVDDMHAIIREHCQSINDNITPRIIDIINKHMLLANANDRYNAKQLEEKFQQVFDTPNNEKPNVPLDILISDPQVMTEPECLSLAKLGEIFGRRQSVAGSTASSPTASTRIVQELVSELKVNVPDRHHLIFIDDSTSMKEHAKSVEEVFPALLYLTRQLEGHKVELSFASNPGCLHRRRRSKKLIRLVANQQYQRMPHTMEVRFAGLVDKAITPHLPNRVFGINFNFFTKKPTSVYVFTDGNWGDRGNREACGVGRPLSRLRRELEDRGLDKNDVSFHFVRFGDSANGKKHLRYLDRSGRPDGRDNVDVKSIFSSVKSIFIGPLSEYNDDSDESD